VRVCSLRQVKIEQRKLNDNSNSLVDMAKVRPSPPLPWPLLLWQTAIYPYSQRAQLVMLFCVCKTGRGEKSTGAFFRYTFTQSSIVSTGPLQFQFFSEWLRTSGNWRYRHTRCVKKQDDYCVISPLIVHLPLLNICANSQQNSSLDFWRPNKPDLNPVDYKIWGCLQNRV